jgi:hypothetical protein
MHSTKIKFIDGSSPYSKDSTAVLLPKQIRLWLVRILKYSRPSLIRIQLNSSQLNTWHLERQASPLSVKTKLHGFFKPRIVTFINKHDSCASYRWINVLSCYSIQTKPLQFPQLCPYHEVAGEWRKLHNGELRDLYSSPSIIRII